MECSRTLLEQKESFRSLGLCREKFIPMLIDLGFALSMQNGLSVALEKLLAYMGKDMGVKRAMINLYHRESGKIFIHRSIGLTNEEKCRGIYHLGEGITGKVFETAKSIIVPCIKDEPSFLNRTKSFNNESEKAISFFCIPILRGSNVLGAISAECDCENEKLLNMYVDILVVASHIMAQAVELYLIEHVDKVFWQQRTQQHIYELKEQFKTSNIIGTSKAMMEVYALLNKVAQTTTTVLLLGESGVGKEMIANAVHFNGTKPDGPFVKFSCAALPESIVESELFGHEKGSFTGASQLRKGYFEQADGGTIFLDEVGELSLGIQAKLLRVLQEKQFERVGGNKAVNVDIRIIAATNRDLARMVSDGRFREDLFYRLNVFPITIPPLRDRGDDILTLAEFFAKKFARETQKNIISISNSAVDVLVNHNWPGNVRELENVIQRAVILSEDKVIHGYDLPLAMQSHKCEAITDRNFLDARLAAVEYEMLVENLIRYGGNTVKAADALGITRRVLGLRMKRHGLNYKLFRSKIVDSPDTGYSSEMGIALARNVDDCKDRS